MLIESVAKSNISCYFSYIPFMGGRQPPVCKGLLIHKVSSSACELEPQSLRLLWTSDQLVTETTIGQHKGLTTNRQQCPLWDSKPQFQQGQTYALGRAATGTGDFSCIAHTKFHNYSVTVSIHCMNTRKCHSVSPLVKTGRNGLGKKIKYNLKY